MKTRYIHIGYPKTGTTTLQASFFPRHPEVLHLGPSARPSEIKEAVEVDLIRKESFAYSSRDIQKVFEPYFEKMNSNGKYKAVGISCEELCFSFDGTGVDRALIAERLKELFGEAKILITIRNQFDFIRSLYSESIKLGCYFSFDEFLKAHYWRFHTYLFHQIYYYPLFKCYSDLFGKDQVKVLLFEELKDRPGETVEEICRFLEISPVKIDMGHANPSLSPFSLGLMRFANRIFKNNFGRSYFMPICPGVLSREKMGNVNGEYDPSGMAGRDAARLSLKLRLEQWDRKLGLKPGVPVFPESWKRLIHALYQEDNRKLAHETGLDLGGHGYPF
jgi:hypothetical protein